MAYDNSPDEPYAPKDEPRSWWHALSNDGFEDPREVRPLSLVCLERSS